MCSPRRGAGLPIVHAIPVDLNGTPGAKDRARCRFAHRQRNEKLARLQMLIGVQVAGSADRSGGNAPGLHLLHEVFHCSGPGPLLNQDSHGIDVLTAHSAVFENLLLRPLRIAHQRHQPLPLRLFDANNLHHAVSASMCSRGSDNRKAQARGLQILVGVPDQTQIEHGRHAFLLRDLDRLALAGFDAKPQRGQCRHRRVDPGLELGLGAEVFQRRQIRAFAQQGIEDRGPAGVYRIEFVGLVVAARTDVAVTRDASDDQPRMAHGKRRALHRARRALRHRDIVDQDIGARYQLVQRGALARIL